MAHADFPILGGQYKVRYSTSSPGGVLLDAEGNHVRALEPGETADDVEKKLASATKKFERFRALAGLRGRTLSAAVVEVTSYDGTGYRGTPQADGLLPYKGERASLRYEHSACSYSSATFYEMPSEQDLEDLAARLRRVEAAEKELAEAREAVEAKFQKFEPLRAPSERGKAA